MGILDHKRTWRFTLAAPEGECTAAFGRAFSGGRMLARAEWSVDLGQRRASAVYKGRAGVAEFLTTLSERSTAEARSAVGSTIEFRAEATGGRTVCTMWLAVAATSLGFTSDARFIRPYMRRVESQLASLDPAMEVTRS